MEEFPWAQIITASATLLAAFSGFLLGGVNEARRDRRTATRDRDARAEDRRALALRARHEFQLETLLALQEATQVMARLTTRAMLFDHMQAREGKQTQLPPDLSDEMHANGVEVNKLRTRILDADLRAEIDSFVSASVDASLTPRIYDNLQGEAVEQAAFHRSTEFYSHATHTMDKLGDALRRELEWTA